MAGEEDIEAVLVWTVIRAGRQLERMVTARLAEQKLTPVQFGILVYLSARPGLNQSEIARAIQIRQQSVNEVVTAMIDRKLITRSGPAGRGRRSGLELTESGQAMLADAWPLVAGINGKTLGLAPGDEATLNRMLHKMLCNPQPSRAV